MCLLFSEPVCGDAGGESTRGLHGSLQGRAGEGRRCQVGLQISGIYHEM